MFPIASPRSSPRQSHLTFDGTCFGCLHSMVSPKSWDIEEGAAFITFVLVRENIIQETRPPLIEATEDTDVTVVILHEVCLV